MQNRPATYTIESAKIQSDAGLEFVIGPFTPPWLTLLVRSGIFLLIGLLVIVLGGKSMFLFGFILLAIAAVFPATLPVAIKIVFNFLTRELTLTANYLLRYPARAKLQVPFSQIARLGFRPARTGNKHIVDIDILDGTKIALDFGFQAQDAQKLVDRFSATPPANNDEAAPVLNSPEVVEQAALAGTQALMQRELRSWSVWLLIMGAGQMIAAQGFSSWGVLLIGVGLASFYFRESAMFVVYAATIAWAGISNLLYSTTTTWNFFAVLQFYLTFVVFKQFRRFQKAELEARARSEAGPETPGRAGKLFPWLSALSGVGALVGYGLTWIGIVVYVILKVSVTQNPLAWQILGEVQAFTTYAGILALAMGLAGWIAAFPRKWASILGTITGALTLLISLVVSLLLKR